MSNQFDARMIWRRLEIWTIDEATGAVATIRNLMDETTKPFRWRLTASGRTIEGRSKSEQAARNAVRSRVIKLPAIPQKEAS